MRLNELAPADELLGDPEALSDRYDQDGCLLVRQAFSGDRIRELGDHVTAVLGRWGVGTVTGDPPVLRWTGRPLEFVDVGELHSVAALIRSTDEFEDLKAAEQVLLDQVCGHHMHLGAGGYFYLNIPDDPAYGTPPHRDGYARTATGDYRRTWVALTHIPFGDGGLVVAPGSHRLGQLPWQEHSGFKKRPDSYTPQSFPRGGVEPEMFDDDWHTAQMHPGDAIIFSNKLVHRSAPATSDRIRVAMAFTASSETGPRPTAGCTTLEDVRGVERIREITAPLGLSNGQVMKVRSDLLMSGLPVTETTVQEALDGKHANWFVPALEPAGANQPAD